MPERNGIPEYLEAVAEQIRWKRARPVLTSELGQHLEDQRDAFLEEGCLPEEAERLAVEEMGDPVSVGVELDRIHRPRPQWGLLLLTLLLAAACCVLKVWLTADWGRFQNVDPVRTAVAFVLGAAGLLAVYFLDYTWLVRRSAWVYASILAVGLLSMWMPPYVQGVAYYSRYALVLFPLGYAFWLYFCRGEGWIGFVLAVLGGVPLALICLVTPYIAGLVLLLVSGLVLLVWAVWCGWFGKKERWKQMAVTAAVAALCITCFGVAFHAGFANSRLLAVLHPEVDPLGRGYAVLMIRQVLEGARWWGEGRGTVDWEGQLYERMPGAEYDCFPVSVIHYLGWGPFLLLVLVLVLLLVWVLCRALRQKSQAGRALVLAVVLTLGLQAVFSLAWNMSFVLLNTHFPLLVGNVYMVMDLTMIGLVLSVFRGDSIVREEPRQISPHAGKRLRVRIVCEWV